MDNITLIMILRHKPHLGVTNQIQGALRRKPLSSRICCVRSPRVPHGDHRCQQSGQNTQQTFPCLQDGLWTFNTGYVTHGSRLHRKCVQQIGEDLNRAAWWLADVSRCRRSPTWTAQNARLQREDWGLECGIEETKVAQWRQTSQKNDHAVRRGATKTWFGVLTARRAKENRPYS